MPAAAANDAVSVLDRMTSILEAFDLDDRGLSISELASRAALPKSTVSRLVGTLVRQRFLERDGRRIHLGIRLFELGQLAEQPRGLRMAALPVMADLRNATGETVHLAMADRHELVCIAAMRGRSAGPLAVRTGGRLPIHATALGKAVLAHDIAAEAGEFIAGVSCVACPVFAPDDELVGALSISGCAVGFDVDGFVPAIRAASSALTRRLASGRHEVRGDPSWSRRPCPR